MKNFLFCTFTMDVDSCNIDDGIDDDMDNAHFQRSKNVCFDVPLVTKSYAENL